MMSQRQSSGRSLLEKSEIYQSLAEVLTDFSQKQKPFDLTAIAEQTYLRQGSIEELFKQWGVDNPSEFLQNLSLKSISATIKETNLQLRQKQEISSAQLRHRYQPLVLLAVMSLSELEGEITTLAISYGIHPTPFGHCLIATTVQGICNLYFLDPQENHLPETYLNQFWGDEAEIIRDQERTQLLCNRIFNPQANGTLPIELYLKGTPFEIEVWQALLKIPFAGIASYQGLATSINRPTAARAIGNAIANNPVAYLIPCHRVVRKTAKIGGYRWGTIRKSLILGWEAWEMHQLEQN